MAAKLEWIGDRLLVGPFVLGCTERRRTGVYAVLNTARGEEDLGMPREDGADAVQDLETEVRRLLKEAGVEVEP